MNGELLSVFKSDGVANLLGRLERCVTTAIIPAECLLGICPTPRHTVVSLGQCQQSTFVIFDNHGITIPPNP